MNKNNFTNLKYENEHLSEEQFLMFADGELSAGETVKAREHLESCWTCRSELEKVEETISLFVEFRKNIQLPLSPPPPNDWNGFNQKLNKIRAEESKPQKNRFSLSNFSIFQTRLGIASLASILILALFWQLITIEKISAAELLEKASVSQKTKIAAASEPVVYQRLQVNAENKRKIDWEVWQDAQKPRAKQLVSVGEGNESVNLLRELAEILRANKMNPQQPLAPESFRAWRDSLKSKTDEISGDEILTLTTTNQETVVAGQIREASMKFRANDYHPFEQTLRVKTETGEKSFQIFETDFEVVSLNTLKPNFFDETPISIEITKVEKNKINPIPQTIENPSVEPNQNLENSFANVEIKTPESEISPKSVATADLEVEVLRLLSDAQADLGEEITVKREAGVLYVRGLVGTSERKAEIFKALESVRQNAAIKIEIETVAEAVAKNKNQPPGKPVTVENVETQTLTTAAKNDLVKHFGSQETAQRFAVQTVNRSSQAMNHVYALRRLSRQFSPSDLRKLSPEAKAKWLALIASHARSFKALNDSLAGDLGKVFGAANGGNSLNAAVNNIEDLPAAIENLFSIAASNDRVIRSALTVSADNGNFSALKTRQFWQSIKNAEVLAGKIAAVK